VPARARIAGEALLIWKDRFAGDDAIARHTMRRQAALQLEAAGSGFVAAGYRPLARETLDEAQDRRGIRRSLIERSRSLARP
jgi:hypothetical protein